MLKTVFIFKLPAMVLVLISILSWQVNARDYISHQLNGQELNITTTEGKVRLWAISEHAFEVLYFNQDKKPFPSFAIDMQSISKNKQNFVTVSNSLNKLTFKNGNLTAVINKVPFDISYFNKDQLLTSEKSTFKNKKSTPDFRFTLTDTEKLLGTGERVLGMDRRGQRLPLYNRAHYGYTTYSEQMNFSIPAVISDKKYLILFDNTANGWVDTGKTQANTLQFEAMGGRNAYLIIAGETYPKLINNYVNITGKQPLPPRWALGNHASRFGYKSQAEVIDTINKYQEEDIPVDSIILDLYWFGKDIKGHMGNLDWDHNTFPDPEKMIKDLKSNGVNTVLITEPFILKGSKMWQSAVGNGVLAIDAITGEAKTYDFYFGHTALIDVFNNDAKHWFASVYKRLADQGVAGVWGDLGEPEVHPADIQHKLSDHNDLISTGDEIHNTYGHEWAKLVKNTLTAHAPEQRPFMIMRSGFAGSQKYGMIPWTGDVSRSWDGLKPQVELSLQMSLLGMAYTHSDLGGFAGGESFDKEMYIRWLQYGVFQPIYRPHGQDNIAPEPIFHDAETKNIIRKFIKLRYKMLPYNYTLAYENAITGMPLMRPMFFNDERNSALIDEKEQYFWGDSFLVKPVTEAAINSIEVDLPKGNWFDYFSDNIYQGNQTISYPLTLNTIPVLVKAGSIIPSVKAVSSTQYYSSEVLKLDYYFDKTIKSSKGHMYEDDGNSADPIKNKQFELLNFEASTLFHTDQLTIALSRSEKGTGYSTMPQQRSVELVIHNWRKDNNKVLFNENMLKQQATLKSLSLVDEGLVYNVNNNTLTIKIKWDHTDSSITVLK
ncbi:MULTISPECIES: TIM-barrel domain-containing protein [unclassified Pseudoalteromonas]|uniref:glycoside hydrolase family 31 protein n=1 Tax=unclassified Pseudoalteromonas TaxID=194690 RepID=UPI0005AB2710|nr:MULTISPECIES: TIM-barrel domain-containing protein [unclassified Pseudoalteromonas]